MIRNHETDVTGESLEILYEHDYIQTRPTGPNDQTEIWGIKIDSVRDSNGHDVQLTIEEEQEIIEDISSQDFTEQIFEGL